MRCTFPELCHWYHESDHPKQPWCTLHDMKIHYINIGIINNCTHHETYKQKENNWKILLANNITK